ncbi:kinase-like domain-containing protein [Rhizophagus clarus]|uniref:Kinase-like domain-containing protein n=1 Tax=Rhizophagus clarus TaxID=94130 RepID=A0A8H3L770_9GLOM|nr:kinase-like domain-containing protein [Rhizophagus clarus]
MSAIREELAQASINRSIALIDYNVHNDIHKQYEFMKQTVLADNSLTKDEKTFAIKWMTRDYDRDKILHNSGTKRICENCKQECLATLYCEICVRNYLKSNFSNWTSGNDDIDNLIQKCQTETLLPNNIIEWIPYNNLQNIKYLTKGGFSDIYTADWIDGRSEEWDPEKQQLIRFGGQNVILKSLENVESANRSWFDEAISHLTISNKWSDIVQCFAPEVINGKEYTFKSDIYSIAMLMWEISSGQPPFINYEHDYNLAINIINGIRPKIVLGTPVEYKNLMEQCWDADPLKRPDTEALTIKIRDMNLFYQNMTDESLQLEIYSNLEFDKTNSSTSNINSRLFTSKIHQFENLPDPRNATEEELEAFHSKSYDFNIPGNIDDFNKSNSQKNIRTSKISSIFKDNKHNYKKETIQQIKGSNTNFNINDDKDDVYNNPNFHSEEQDEFEIPDDI